MILRNLLLTFLILLSTTATAGGQLTAIGAEYWTQHVPGMPGAPANQDAFGGRLTKGDFDGDGYDDLVVGIYGDGALHSGAVHVFYGSPSGFTAANSQLWNQDSPGIPGADEALDLFGRGIGAGDFDADGYDDLAIGIPGKAIGGVVGCGSVLVLYGTASGLVATGLQLWNDLNLPIELDRRDGLGLSLASGHFDDDEYADLAMSIPGETVLGASRAGAVLVLYGSVTGLTQVGIQTWHQDVSGVLGAAAVDERFGNSLASGDFDGDSYDDLAIGVPGDIVSNVDAGAVNVLYGTTIGLSTNRNQLWSQGTPGLPFVPEADDAFGWALATGDFNGDGADELAIGVPFEDHGAFTDSGAIHVLYGSDPDGLSVAGALAIVQGDAGTPGQLGIQHHLGIALSSGDFDG
ncbi:MAG: FG-GAP-like repeat-containing protein, partial [Thermoanaerobaculia bacterium]|nr:FG-GAP-like repeat-containing protein [Thermoanaerobaculia bacterium]